MFIAVDLLALRADDPGDLWAIHAGFDINARTPALPSRHRLKLIAIAGGLAPSLLLQRLRLLATVLHANWLPPHIHLIHRVALQLETEAWLQATGIAAAIGQHRILPQGIEAIMGQRLTTALLLKTPGKIVMFKPAIPGLQRLRIGLGPLELQTIIRLQEAVILQSN